MNEMRDPAGIILLFIYTVLCGAEDIRNREIGLGLSALFAAAGILLCIYVHRSWSDLWPALVPGLLCLIIAGISGGAVGAGDAVYLLVSGLYAGTGRLAGMITVSLLFSAGTALLMIAGGYAKCKNIRKTTLPYLAFMTPALVVTLLF